MGSAPRPTLSGFGERWSGDAARHPGDWRRRPFARRIARRVHPHGARVPHLEALPGGQGPGRVDLRPGDKHGRTDYRRSVHRQPARVGGRYDLLHFRSGLEAQPLRLRPGDGRYAPGHEPRGVRRPVAERRTRRCGVRERRLHLSLRPGERGLEPPADPCGRRSALYQSLRP